MLSAAAGQGEPWLVPVVMNNELAGGRLWLLETHFSVCSLQSPSLDISGHSGLLCAMLPLHPSCVWCSSGMEIKLADSPVPS